MSKLLKKSRLILAVTMLVQAVSMFVLFITQLARRRSLAYALLALSAVETAAGSYLLWQWTEDEKDKRERKKLEKQMEENPDTFEIPLDEDADEEDFA